MGEIGFNEKAKALSDKGFKNSEHYSTADFLEIIRILRSPSGCPWDREQTHKSLTSNLIEESYEAVEAISKEDASGLCEELGDVLLQVMLHSVIAEESGAFSFSDVVDVVSRKMIVRHPHVFADVKADSAEEVLKNWDAIKRGGDKGKNFDSKTEISSEGEGFRNAELGGNAESGGAGQQKLLRDVPKTLPALMRAAKVQGRARNVGFDFESLSEVFEVLEGEIEELREAVRLRERAEIEGELGDVLFSAVNLSRFLKIDSELALNDSTDKFISRFSDMENLAREKNLQISDASMEELNTLWDIVKADKKPYS